MSGDGAFGFGKGSTRTGTQTSTFVDPAQQPFLDFIRSAGQGLFENQQQNIGSLFGLAGGLQQQGQEGLQNLNQIGGQLAAPQQVGFGQGQQGVTALNALTRGEGLGQDQLQRIAGGNDPAVAGQIGQLGQDIQRQFNQLLPGISTQAIGGGQLGGGRQGVAQGLGLQASQDAFGRGAAQIRFDDLSRQLQAGTALSQQAGQAGQQLGVLGLQNQLGQAGINQQGLQSAAQAQLGGLGELQNQFNLGFSPFQAEFFPAQSLSGIFGGPTVLSEGESFGRTNQFNANVGGVGGFF